MSIFWKPQKGRVLVNDYDVKDIGYKQIRSHVGIVSQDCPLFNATIKENIAYARMNATHEEIVDAAKSAELKVLIRRINRNKVHLYTEELTDSLAFHSKKHLGYVWTLLPNATVVSRLSQKASTVSCFK